VLKALILKLGNSETLDPEIGRTPSLGDVLRTTVILHCLKDYNITWLVEESAYPLIENNPMIDRVLIRHWDSLLQLESERYDLMINLEKTPGMCALADRIHAWEKCGFRFDPETGTARAYKDSVNAFLTYSSYERKRYATRPWQDVLFEMLDRKWNGEPYVLGYKPKSEVRFKVGLNHRVGRKWPNKAWPTERWNELYSLLDGNIREVSWQEGENDLRTYMDWIHSCKSIITNDSLGLHLAIAMQKKTVALFGPTSPHEVYLYKNGKKIIAPDICGHMPCLKPTCQFTEPCMKAISAQTVNEETRRLVA